MIRKLHKFVPPFTLYLNFANAQNSTQYILKRPLYIYTVFTFYLPCLLMYMLKAVLNRSYNGTLTILIPRSERNINAKREQ